MLALADDAKAEAHILVITDTKICHLNSLE
jgi:hypothetical protein